MRNEAFVSHPLNVSRLQDARDEHPQAVSVLSVIGDIGSGSLAGPIRIIRERYQAELAATNGDHKEAKKAVSSLKKQLPAVQWSGVFSARGDKNVVSYSGLLCADLDHLDGATIARTLEALTLDEHCYTTFISPTGTGIKAVFRVSPVAEDHPRNYEAVKHHVFENYALEVDTSCYNMERLCFLSNGIEHLNEKSIPLELLPELPKVNGTHKAPRSSSAVFTPRSRQDIATKLLGGIEWTSDTEGFGRCPGEHLHTGENGQRDFKIMMDGVPTLTCFHESCKGIVAGINHSLRSDVAKVEYIPPVNTAGAATVAAEHFRSDIGYADAFVRRHGQEIRFCAEEERWLVFDQENGWRRDGSNRIKSMFANYARELYRDALEQAKDMDPAIGKRLIDARAGLGNKKRIEPALSFAACNPSVVIHATQLDADPFLVGVLNGVVDLQSGSFQPHRPEHLVTRRLEVHYDANATAPTWDRFLDEVQPDPKMRSFLQRLSGYSITGAIREHVLPFHYGVGANGKGTFLEHAMLKLLGDYGAKLTNGLVYANDRAKCPLLELAELCGRRFGLGEENNDGARLNEGALKSITGGDRQKGRFHYKEHVEYFPTYKIALVGNHKPRIDGTDDGIWRRFLLVDWPVQIPSDKRDGKLPDKLAVEMSGILNWCIAGARAWMAEGLNPPESCRAATEAFREKSDELVEFIEDGFEKDHDGYCTKAEAFDAYKRWAGRQGISRPMSKRCLGVQFVNRGWREFKRGDGRSHCWAGYRLKNQFEG